MRAIVFVLTVLLAAPALADLDRSQRPVARPDTVAAVQTKIKTRPHLRLVGRFAGDGGWLRPVLRSRQLEERVMARRRAAQRGALCGDVDLQGDVVGQVPGRIRGCGIKDAVRLASVAGVGLTQSALMDCGTARALKTWVEGSAKPALSSIGGGLSQLRVAAHYVCRTRNHQSGARISEHGKGRAIDISAFVMRDGRVVTVEDGWGSRGTARALRRMHKGACGPFGTVLGPESDRFHKDHFHFDTARHRSGSYCR